MATHYLACDLGAESGRLMLGVLADGKLQLRELHRFPNGVVTNGDSLHWDIDALFRELKTGLAKAAATGLPISSYRTDSWGLDYLLFDADGQIISPTFAYRDRRTAIGCKKVFKKIDWETLFTETGIQMMEINTLFQLAAETPDRLQGAEYLLSVGDGFNHLLCGARKMDTSMASTFQLYNPTTKNWSEMLAEMLSLPSGLLPELVTPGTKLGPLLPEITKETGLAEMEVIATCTHDTGAAVAAVPASAGEWAYLSSGTWSLMGVELDAPLLTPECGDLNFTNEIGYGNSVRLLKNIVGLWIIQECRRGWEAAGQECDYAELTRLAGEATPFRSLIDPAYQSFALPGGQDFDAQGNFVELPGGMAEKIAIACNRTKQPAPETLGEVTRCVLESLALLYRKTLLEVESLTGRRIERLHVVGGGSRNALLNQFTANALGIPVIAGPAEATAAGNVLVQAITLGHVESLSAAREIVAESFDLETYEPQDAEAWEAAYDRFRKEVDQSAAPK